MTLATARLRRLPFFFLLTFLTTAASFTSTTTVTAFVTTTTPTRNSVESCAALDKRQRSTTKLRVFGKGSSKSNTAPNNNLQEALACYPYEFVSATNAKKSAKICCTKQEATQAYQELSKLYGDDAALQIVQTQPIVLTFDALNFAPCLDAWEEQFGLQNAQAMVRRNPGLLAVPPILAQEPAEASMALSYAVALFRPSPIKVVALGILLANALPWLISLRPENRL